MSEALGDLRERFEPVSVEDWTRDSSRSPDAGSPVYGEFRAFDNELLSRLSSLGDGLDRAGPWLRHRWSWGFFMALRIIYGRMDGTAWPRSFEPSKDGADRVAAAIKGFFGKPDIEEALDEVIRVSVEHQAISKRVEPGNSHARTLMEQ